MTDVEIRPIDGTELPAFFRTIVEAFGDDARDEDREREALLFEPERSLACFDGGEIVGTTAIYTRTMTMPGGPRPFAGVTAVSVAPTHRRRGLLTDLMRRQLTDLHEDGREAVAALWASEGPIYGRFGYGPAARRVILTGTKDRMRLRPDLPTSSGRVTLVPVERARPHEEEVYGAVAARTPGFLARDERWWDRALFDGKRARHGATARRHVLHTEQDGSVTGYATYRCRNKWSPEENRSEVEVGEVFATTPSAYGALWSFLAGIDLHPVVTRRLAPLEDPLETMLVDPRALRRVVDDSLWIRLVDVDRALAGRAYSAPVDVVLEVADTFCPWNAGRWRLSGDASGATCERTADAADLTVASTELGAAYLGGPRLALLAGAGLLTENTPGALAAASRAFAGEQEPWCPEVF
ncbi:MAG TPA: GNAT family N-acetyltransferase [Mycobacteriales bacterium]